MRLYTHATAEGPRCAVLVDGRLVDVASLLGTPGPVRDVADLTILDGPGLESLRSTLTAGGSEPDGQPIEEATLLPPVLRPPSIRDHIAFEEHASRQYTREIAEVWHRRPIHYYSNPSRLVGHQGLVVVPATERLDYELELAVVIGAECSDLAVDDALDAVVGITILNDWSARDLQADEMAYGLGPAKGKDFATSLGPCVVTLDELTAHFVDGVLDLACEVVVNGEVWARSRSGSQAHSWGAMLAHASQDSLLLPGDVLASGTVGGCSIGEAIRKGYAAHYLVPGDVVELRVEGLGSLVNSVVANARPADSPHYRAPALPEMPVPLAGLSTPTA